MSPQGVYIESGQPTRHSHLIIPREKKGDDIENTKEEEEEHEEEEGGVM